MWDILNKEGEKIQEGYVLAMFTDKVVFDYYPTELISNEEIEKKLLDMRVFNSEMEIRAFRGTINKSLNIRVLSENGVDSCDYFDQIQFLDIDDSRSRKNDDGKSCSAFTTSGGKYKLPCGSFEDMGLVIRSHIDYDENGQAFIKDWRLTEIRKISGKHER